MGKSPALANETTYHIALIVYVHRNPEHHGLFDDFRQWRYSSYQVVLAEQPTQIARDEVLAWFGGRRAFLDAHGREPSGEHLGELAMVDV